VFWCTANHFLHLICLQQKDPNQYESDERIKNVFLSLSKIRNNRVLIYRASLHDDSTGMMRNVKKSCHFLVQMSV